MTAEEAWGQMIAWFVPAASRNALYYAVRLERAEPWVDTAVDLLIADADVRRREA